jgi:hypothetical protein
MRWSQIGLGAQDLNDIQRPEYLVYGQSSHRRNRKSGQATRGNASEPDVYLLVTIPFLGGETKLSE